LPVLIALAVIVRMILQYRSQRALVLGRGEFARIASA